MSHPYLEYEETRLWEIISKAIDDLVENGDLEEKTKREYIVGYLYKVLIDNKSS